MKLKQHSKSTSISKSTLAVIATVLSLCALVSCGSSRKDKLTHDSGTVTFPEHFATEGESIGTDENGDPIFPTVTEAEQDTYSTEALTQTDAADSDAPTEALTEEPTAECTEAPTEMPTEEPTEEPTEAPTETEEPTEAETEPPVSLEYRSFGNGTCCVVGIGTSTDVCVVIPERSPSGDIVTAIEDKAFYRNEKIKAVQISSTVTSIGEMAFGGCSSLVYVSVDDGNRAYCDVDGILYSLDKSVIVAYPSASGARELTISVHVTEIAPMAFYGCDNLTTINYTGTVADWGNIDIGDYNYGLFTASINCADYNK